MSTIFTPPRFTPVSGAGTTYPAAELHFTITGTSTPKNTYSDADLAPGNVNTNPVVADANGLFGPIYLTSGDYKVILKDASGNTIWTVDPYSGLAAGDTLTTRGDILTRDATTYKRLPIGTPDQVLTSDGVDVEWRDAVATGVTGVRQTVQGGPVTSAGLPDFLPATDVNLDLASQNITASYPFVVSAANGFSSGGPAGRIGISTANLTWLTLTASRAAATPNFLYVTVLGDGTVTTGSTIVAPIYQWGGVPATTNGLFTFNISEMKGYLGNGSSAPQAYMVFVGEAATDGSSVISTVAYAYNGRYDSGYTATAPATTVEVVANHNLGVIPRIKDFCLQCTTTDLGWAVGDEIGVGSYTINDGINPYGSPSFGSGAKAMNFVYTGNIALGAKTTGAYGNITNASWKYRSIAERGW